MTRAMIQALFFAGTMLIPTLICGQENTDLIRKLQLAAIEEDHADWGHWGYDPGKYTDWTNHSNRLIPVYTFGISLDKFDDENSIYRNREKIKKLYGHEPEKTLNPNANYFDQTDIYWLQQLAREQGKRNIVLIVFDGMDWQTTQAAAIYRNQAVTYKSGRGNGLSFQDYDKTEGDFGFVVTSPDKNGTKFDVNAQIVTGNSDGRRGGYNAELGGRTPWSQDIDLRYLVGRQKTVPHPYTDSAASATSLMSGIKTYNSAINVDRDGKQIVPIARELQNEGLAIGVVTSVPISHATPACAYGNNVNRNDYQDLTRDLLGLPSNANPEGLTGVDVLIGCGWSEKPDEEDEKSFANEFKRQGTNFVPGNRYLDLSELDQVDVRSGGKYVVATRSDGVDGATELKNLAKTAAKKRHRLFGFFGTKHDHLPYQTADGDYNPTRGNSKAEVYSQSDIHENPTLADMTEAALKVLETNENGFWLMIEPGDVDWANHSNNLDDSIGAVYSGEAAFNVVVDWIERNHAWDDSCVIVTADHGHLLVLTDPSALVGVDGKDSR